MEFSSLELPRDRRLEIACEADRVKRKYHPQTVEDLERIAVEEYGVAQVIRTPLADPSGLVRDQNSNLILFYHAWQEANLPLFLGHEMGHVALGHAEKLPWVFQNETEYLIWEAEADHFSARLNSISSDEFRSRQYQDSSVSFWKAPLYWLQRKERKSEIQRLKDLGIYHLL